MKTYEEMAESVLRIGREKQAAELRKRKILMTGGTVAVCLLLAIGGILAQRVWNGNEVPAVFPMEDGVPAPQPSPAPVPAAQSDPQTDGVQGTEAGEHQDTLSGTVNGPADPSDWAGSADGQIQAGPPEVFGPEGIGENGRKEAANYSIYYGKDDNVTDAQSCYDAPDNGICNRSPMVENAIRDLGPDNPEIVVLQIKGYLFLNNAQCGEADLEVFAREAQRLERDAGIRCGIVREEDGVYHLAMELTPAQAAAFPAGEECGWFLFFRDQPV